MIGNFRSFNKQQMNLISDEKISNIEYNVPCKVDKINEDYTVNLSNLIDGTTYYNISIFFPIGITFNPEILKYGFLINSSYWFDSMLVDNTITKEIKSYNTKFGFFIPMLSREMIDFYNKNNLKEADLTLFNKEATNKISLETDNIIIDNKEKAFINMEDGSIAIKNNQDNESIVMDNKIEITSKQDVVKLDSGISLNSSSAMDISTQVASLKEIIDGLVECINLASISTSTSPGSAVTPNPQLSIKISELQTKINGVLK